MFIPKVGQILFYQDRINREPRMVKVKSVVDEDTLNITSFIHSDGKFNSYTSTAQLSCKHSRFFDVPNTTMYYYVVVGYHDNAYDALDVYDESYHMDIGEAFEACAQIERRTDTGADVVIRHTR